MGKEYDTRSFKSGNSVAIRIPAALGVEPDREWTVAVDENGDLVLHRKDKPRRTIDISGFAGKLPGFRPAPREDFEDRPSAIAQRKAWSGD